MTVITRQNGIVRGSLLHARPTQITFIEIMTFIVLSYGNFNLHGIEIRQVGRVAVSGTTLTVFD